MKRITRNELFMEVAKLFAKRSRCSRLQVGCVIVKDNRIISSGCNGPLGTDKTVDYDIAGFCECDRTSPCANSIHAEHNAILFAAKKGISLEGAIVYVTHSPCRKCSEALIQAGVNLVVYGELFRDSEPLNYLEHNGVRTEQYG